MIARLIRILLWIFETDTPCDRSDCTEGELCEDCAAYWSIR